MHGGHRLKRRPTDAPERRLRRGHRGLTLVETLVTMALLAIVTVGLTGGVVTVERLASVNQNQSQLEVAMRQFSDWARDSSNSSCLGGAGLCPSLPYALCGGALTQSTATARYTSNLSAAISSGALTPPSRANLSVVAVYFSTGASHDTVTSTSPQQSCFGTTCPGASCVGDWGVQEIVLNISLVPDSVKRTIWKSYDWCWKGPPSTGSSC